MSTGSAISRPLQFVALLVMAGAGFAIEVAGADEPLQFNRDIQPILADHCLACHGPDRQARQSGVRLDRPETAFGL